MAGSNKRRISHSESENPTQKLKHIPPTDNPKPNTIKVSETAPSDTSMDTESLDPQEDKTTNKQNEKIPEPTSRPPNGGEQNRTAETAAEKDKLFQLECYPSPETLQYEVVDPKVATEGAYFAPFKWLPLHVRLWCQKFLKEYIGPYDEVSTWLVVKVLQPVSGSNEGGDFLMIPKMLEAWIKKTVKAGPEVVIRIPIGRDSVPQFYLVALESRKARKKLLEFNRLDRGVYIGTANLPGALLLFDVALSNDQLAPKMQSLLVGIAGLPALTNKRWVQGCLDAVRGRSSNDLWGVEGVFERDFNNPEYTGMGRRIVEVQMSDERMLQWFSYLAVEGFDVRMEGWKHNAGTMVKTGVVYNTNWALLPTCGSCGLTCARNEHKPKCPFHLIKDDLLSRGKFKKGAARARGHPVGLNAEPKVQPQAKAGKSGIFDRVLDD